MIRFRVGDVEGEFREGVILASGTTRTLNRRWEDVLSALLNLELETSTKYEPSVDHVLGRIVESLGGEILEIDVPEPVPGRVY